MQNNSIKLPEVQPLKTKSKGFFSSKKMFMTTSIQFKNNHNNKTSSNDISDFDELKQIKNLKQQLQQLTEENQQLQDYIQRSEQSKSFIKKLGPSSQCLGCDILNKKITLVDNKLKESEKNCISYKTNVDNLTALNQKLNGSLNEWIQKFETCKNIVEQHKLSQQNSQRQLMENEDLINQLRNIEQFYLIHENEPQQLIIFKKNTLNGNSQDQQEKQLWINNYNQVKKQLDDQSELSKNTLNLLKKSDQFVQELQVKCKNLEQTSSKYQKEILILKEQIKTISTQQSQVKKYELQDCVSNNIHALKNTIDQNIEQTKKKQESDIATLLKENAFLKQRLKEIQDSIDKRAKNLSIFKELLILDNFELSLHRELQCKNCRELLQGSITCIPCGHTYCKKCHKGVKLSCSICDKTANIEALYHNKQLDELVKVFSYVKEIKEVIKTCLVKFESKQ